MSVDRSVGPGLGNPILVQGAGRWEPPPTIPGLRIQRPATRPGRGAPIFSWTKPEVGPYTQSRRGKTRRCSAWIGIARRLGRDGEVAMEASAGVSGSVLTAEVVRLIRDSARGGQFDESGFRLSELPQGRPRQMLELPGVRLRGRSVRDHPAAGPTPRGIPGKIPRRPASTGPSRLVSAEGREPSPTVRTRRAGSEAPEGGPTTGPAQGQAQAEAPSRSRAPGSRCPPASSSAGPSPSRLSSDRSGSQGPGSGRS
jgi:hypothetical protein